MPLILEQEPKVRFRDVAQIFITDFIRHAATEEVVVTTDATSIIAGTITGTIPLSGMEQVLIELIRQYPAIKLQELAERLNVTKGGVRYHIDKLKNKKILLRTTRCAGSPDFEAAAACSFALGAVTSTGG